MIAVNVPSFGRRTQAAPTPMPGVEEAPRKRSANWIASGSPITEDIVTELRNTCLSRLDPNAIAAMPAERLIMDLERLISEIATERRFQLNGREQHILANELVHDITGLGPLEQLLEDDGIADIMVNGPHRTFVEKGGKVSMANIHFRDQAHLMNVCQRIAAAVGRRIDESSPMVDARLKDGSRVNIVFPPLALEGPYISIRKFGKKAVDFAQLIRWRALTLPVARVLEIASQARLNIVVSGGTGSGKTTMMNAMSRLIDHGERVITVEDAAELQFQQPHVVRLETRPSSLEGRGGSQSARPRAQRSADAARPDHHRRGPRR